MLLIFESYNLRNTCYSRNINPDKSGQVVALLSRKNFSFCIIKSVPGVYSGNAKLIL